MTDILKEEILKNKKAKIETWTCEKCERHFMVLDIMPVPFYCPFCNSSLVSENDEFEITLYKNAKK